MQDLEIFEKANLVVSGAELALRRTLEYGEVVDLLADNLDWPLPECQYARDLMIRVFMASKAYPDGRTRFRTSSSC